METEKERDVGKKHDELVDAHHMMSADGFTFIWFCQVLKVPPPLQSIAL